MGTEIERKFLVVSDQWRSEAERQARMVQGYVANGPRASVRVRIAGDRAWLNIKAFRLGAERAEFEYGVPVSEAEDMLATLCGEHRLEKTRYWVPWGGLMWEVDEFDGANAGLVVAELELEAVDQVFDRPPWVGAEVTELERYYNVRLVERPYRAWTEAERRGP